jgi:hypothetical protein
LQLSPLTKLQHLYSYTFCIAYLDCTSILRDKQVPIFHPNTTINKAILSPLLCSFTQKFCPLTSIHIHVFLPPHVHLYRSFHAPRLKSMPMHMHLHPYTSTFISLLPLLCLHKSARVQDTSFLAYTPLFTTRK